MLREANRWSIEGREQVKTFHQQYLLIKRQRFVGLVRLVIFHLLEIFKM